MSLTSTLPPAAAPSAPPLLVAPPDAVSAGKGGSSPLSDRSDKRAPFAKRVHAVSEHAFSKLTMSRGSQR